MLARMLRLSSIVYVDMLLGGRLRHHTLTHMDVDLTHGYRARMEQMVCMAGTVHQAVRQGVARSRARVLDVSMLGRRCMHAQDGCV